MDTALESLALFFEYCQDEILANISAYSLGSTVQFYGKQPLHGSEIEVALIGLGDSANEIRKKLYNFSPLQRTVRLVDLGNLRCAETWEDTCARLREVCEKCLTYNILSIIIGDHHELDYGQFWSYETSGKIITIVSVDKTIDLQHQNHVHKILSHRPNYLIEYSHLAFQRHETSPEILETLQELNFELMSVGQMRDRHHDIEPIIRAADMLSFDVSALKSSAGVSPYSSPFGLTNEEACQICWYAGMSEMLTSVGFYGYTSRIDNSSREGAYVIATMIWYFLEGFLYRKDIYPFRSNFYIRYIVPIPHTSLEITFYKSKLTNKWWIETTTQASQAYDRKKVIPCSYQDYEEACKGNIPERWLRALDKL